jgi:hypothetical protein
MLNIIIITKNALNEIMNIDRAYFGIIISFQWSLILSDFKTFKTFCIMLLNEPKIDLKLDLINISIEPIQQQKRTK